jgi:hypothetical protein
MDVVPLAPLRITFIPIRSGGRVGNLTANGRTLASWVDNLSQMYPLGQVTAQVAGEYVTPLDPNDLQHRGELLEARRRSRTRPGTATAWCTCSGIPRPTPRCW